MSEKLPEPCAEKETTLDQAASHSDPKSGGAIRERKQSKDVAPRPSEAAPVRGPFPFRYRDQLLLGVACAVALLFMAVYCVRIGRWGASPIELERQPQHELDYKIDLNSATWVEWSQLPGIGQVLAKRIVNERDQNGPFRDIDDLDRVTGIGPIKIEAIRPFIQTGTRGGASEPRRDLPEQVGSSESP